MYKDPQKQKQAAREAQARFKASKKVLPQNQAKNKVLPKNGVIEPKKDVQDTPQSTNLGNTQPVIPSKVIPKAVIPAFTGRPARRIPTSEVINRVKEWPDVELPFDPEVDANNTIGWSDIMQLDRSVIDAVYRTSKALWNTRGSEPGSAGDDVLLRLRRAAGYQFRINNGAKLRCKGYL